MLRGKGTDLNTTISKKTTCSRSCQTQASSKYRVLRSFTSSHQKMTHSCYGPYWLLKRHKWNNWTMNYWKRFFCLLGNNCPKYSTRLKSFLKSTSGTSEVARIMIFQCWGSHIRFPKRRKNSTEKRKLKNNLFPTWYFERFRLHPKDLLHWRLLELEKKPRKRMWCFPAQARIRFWFNSRQVLKSEHNGSQEALFALSSKPRPHQSRTQ